MSASTGFASTSRLLPRRSRVADRVEPLLAAAPCTVLLAASEEPPAVRRFRIGEDVRALLEACDGTCDAASIAAFARRPPSAVAGALEALRGHNVLTYHEDAR